MSITIPDSPSFQEAIALTQDLLQSAEGSGGLDADAIAQLTRTKNGARGFFVVYLTAENSPAAEPTDSVLKALATQPDTVNDLLVKNVVMSAAMTITHDRNGDAAMVANSQTTSDRSIAHVKGLLALGGPPAADLEKRVRTMGEALSDGSGEYAGFLDKWNYDEEQRDRMATAIAPIIETLG